MKPLKYKKNIIMDNINNSFSPNSVNLFSRKKYISIINPLRQDFNYSYLNKKNFSNNNENNLCEINNNKNNEEIEFKNNEIINEGRNTNIKRNYDNLSVKIYNLYNIKDKNKQLSIKINNSSPKYYMNNCVNQLILNRLKTENINTNNESNLTDRINLDKNINKNNLFISLVSPKMKPKKAFIIENNSTENMINYKFLHNNTKRKANNQIIQKKNKKNLIMNNYNDFSYYNNKQIFNNNKHNLLGNKIDNRNNSQIDKPDEFFYNSGTRTCQNLKVKNIINKKNKNINNRVLKTNLTLENTALIPNNFKNKQKCNNIKTTQVISFSNINPVKKCKNDNLEIHNTVEKNQNRNNKKDNTILNSIFDLNKNKYESETINKIIKDFYENEEKELDKNRLNNKIENLDKNKAINQKIEKVIANNSFSDKHKIMKMIKTDDVEIHLQYNQDKQVEKIFLKDKYGNLQYFIPSLTNNDKFNTIDNIIK